MNKVTIPVPIAYPLRFPHKQGGFLQIDGDVFNVTVAMQAVQNELNEDFPDLMISHYITDNNGQNHVFHAFWTPYEIWKMVYYHDVWKERDWTNVIIFENNNFTLTPILKEIKFYDDSRDLRAFILKYWNNNEKPSLEHSVVEIFEHHISGVFSIDYVRTTEEDEFEPPYGGHRFLICFQELTYHKIVSGNQQTIESPVYMAITPSELLFTPQLEAGKGWRKDSLNCPFEEGSQLLPRQENIKHIPNKE